MKKILVLLCVLGLVASANAAIITMKANGSTGTVDVAAGSTVTITIVSDTAVGSSYLVSLTQAYSGMATGNIGADGLGTFNTGFTLTATHALRNAMTNNGAGTPRYMLIDRIVGQINVPNADPAIAAGQILYSFDITVPSDAEVSSTWTITAATLFPAISPPPTGYAHQQDASDITSTNAVSIHVPEPMTIALLGLGGLFLRRRK